MKTWLTPRGAACWCGAGARGEGCRGAAMWGERERGSRPLLGLALGAPVRERARPGLQACMRSRSPPHVPAPPTHEVDLTLVSALAFLHMAFPSPAPTTILHPNRCPWTRWTTPRCWASSRAPAGTHTFEGRRSAHVPQPRARWHTCSSTAAAAAANPACLHRSVPTVHRLALQAGVECEGRWQLIRVRVGSGGSSLGRLFQGLGQQCAAGTASWVKNEMGQFLWLGHQVW